MPTILKPKDPGINQVIKPVQNPYAKIRAENFGKVGNGTYYKQLNAYGPLLYDPTSLDIGFDDGGLKWAAMPDNFGIPWLVAVSYADGSDLYDYNTLGAGDSLVDPRNGISNRKGDECQPYASSFPDHTNPNSYMFSSQSIARKAYLDCVRSNYRMINTPFVTNMFYAPPKFLHFNTNEAWREDLNNGRQRIHFVDDEADGGNKEWDADSSDMLTVWSPNELWNTSKGIVGTPSQNQIQLGNDLLPTCHFLTEVNFSFVDPKTKDTWTFTGFGDVVTRTCYLTQARNQTAYVAARKLCAEKQINYIKALAEAIADTIKGIIAIVIGVFTLNVGAIGGGVALIVNGWYNFAEAKKELEDAISGISKGLKDSKAGVDMANKLYGLKSPAKGSKIADLLKNDPNAGNKNAKSLLDSNGGKLAAAVIVGVGVYAIAA